MAAASGMRLTAIPQTFGVAERECGETFGEDGLRAGERRGEVGAGEMAFGGFGEVVVPDVAKGGVEADAFEAVVKADGPALLAGERREGDFGEVLEAGDPGGVC